MTPLPSLVIAVASLVLLGAGAIVLTGYLLSVPLATGGPLADLRNVLVVTGALPGGVLLLLLGPFLPRGVRAAVVEAFPEPRTGQPAPRRSTGFAPADD